MNALGNNTTGSSNTAIGHDAGNTANQTTQNNNTYIGANTSSNGNYSNSTAIGYGAQITENNVIKLGTASETVRCFSLQTIYNNSPGTVGAYMYNFGGLGNPLAIMCSISNMSNHLNDNSDEAYLVLPGYRLFLYDGFGYTSLTQDIDNTSGMGVIYVGCIYPNTGSSCRLYFKGAEVSIGGIS